MNATQERFKPEEYPSYVEGDIVCLKSGGPDMVVLSYCDECDDVDVAYAAADGIEILTLPAACLTRIH